MALNFPDSPSNGDVAHGFTYNSTKGVWEASKKEFYWIELDSNRLLKELQDLV